MKLVTYEDGKVGRVDGDVIVRLEVPTMRDYFARGGADDTTERTSLADATLHAPIVPKKYFHTAGNFREHEEESKNVNWTHEIAPWIVFFQNVDAIVGPDEPVVYPEHLTEELDYELELAVIIGKDGKWFGPEEAMDYVAGYVIFNDITARDIQRREMRSGVFSFCKAIDTFCPLGPWIVFFQNVDAIVGPDEPVIYPEHLTEELDYELELAVIIGKDGKWFGPEEAMDYVAGYVIFNDITARDIQRREMRSGVFSFCKAIDTFCPLGPWIVTADEIPDPHDLAMTLRVNGETRQTSHSGRMSTTIPEIVSHYSPLGYSAGDVLSTGTVSGVAGFSEDAASLYLKPGDVIEAEIEGIGVLRNPVVSWQEAHGEPPPARVRW
jgi:2-keto-4-pentenoate hydratase/2-oxohepta-3-ene-1,7-dioic acid hydratase in catechol pathway